MVIGADICDKDCTVSTIIINKVIGPSLYAGILIPDPPVTILTDMGSNAVYAVNSVNAVYTVTAISAVNAVTAIFTVLAVFTFGVTCIDKSIISKAYHKVTVVINSCLFDAYAVLAIFTVTSVPAVNTVTTIFSVNAILAVYSIFAFGVSCIYGAAVAHGKNKVSIFIDVSTYNGNSRRTANGKQHYYR